MPKSFIFSHCILWLILSRVNSSVIPTSSNGATQQTPDGGVYVPKDVGNDDPNLHYGIVIDCGSSGSRLYIYVWPEHSGKSDEMLQIKQLLDEKGVPIVKKLEPGLSSMAKNPGNATEYLKSLLDFAADKIPPTKHTDTPLYILATAGLRFLPLNEQNQILEDLFKDIERDYDFEVDKTHFQVISGELEGVYGWIAINYVLGRFQYSTSENRPSTVGILDMGGGSAQIAFEVSQTIPVTGKEVAEFCLGYDDNQDRLKYKIYVTTFLGYGANKVFEKYIDRIVSIAQQTQSTYSSSLAINDADCLPRGYTTNYTRNNQTIYVTGEGDFLNCAKHLTNLLNLNATCPKKPCSFNGVYQPEINYKAQDFYGFSEFWYTMQDILKIGGPYARLTFLNASTGYCNENWEDIQKIYNEKLYPNINLNRLMLQCFKSAWLYAFLHDGLKFPIDYQRLRSASLVNNNDVQWALGAILYKTRFHPLKAINRTRNHTLFHPIYPTSRTLFVLICMALTICLFIFVPQRIRRFLFHQKQLHSSTNSSNYQYQLLSSFANEELPVSTSTNTYSNTKRL